MRPTVAFDRLVGRPLYRLHVRLYRMTNGRIGHRSPVGPMLLLTTRGRRSGRLTTTPLLYLDDGAAVLVVASNGGRAQQPHWLLNVRTDPRVVVQAGSRRRDARATVVSDAERAELWPRLTAHYAGWAHYETLTDRPLCVVRVEYD